MWRMSDGDRALTEAEWAVFRLGLGPLVDAVEDDLAYDTDDAAAGVPAFDRLTAGQKLALLADVTSALRNPASSTPPHTAAGEGAIAADFAAIRDELEIELDGSDGAAGRADRTPVRRRLRAVAAEYRPGAGKLPPPTRGGRRAWADIVEAFEGRVFWDDDYELGDEFLDLPPDEARVRLRLAGIPDDYFLATPADPGERGLVAARQALAGLLGRPAPDDAGLYPALLDRYHDLFVGPVTPGEVAAWADQPWVEAVGLANPGWDCDYPTWRAAFGGAVPAAPFRVDPAAPGGPELPAGVVVEFCGGGWVVRSGDGSYWCGLTDNGWAGDPGGGVPALSFPTEAAARAAFAQADRMYGERAARRAAACARLGLPG